jgi:exosome complex component RRP42
MRYLKMSTSNNNNNNHFKKTLSKGFRYDNRKLDEFRNIVIETNIVETAEGSARVKIGQTEVIAGVKMSIEKPYPDSPEKGNISVNVELLPLSSPNFESGPPGIKAVEIARVVDRGIRESHAIDLEALCIEKGEKVWTLFIDICSINDDGNLQDAASLATLVAIMNTRLPKVEDGRIDYKTLTDKKLILNNHPIEVTVYKVGENIIVDPTSEEEDLYDSRLIVAVIDDGRICALQKSGQGTISIDYVDKMISLAIDRAQEIRKILPN